MPFGSIQSEFTNHKSILGGKHRRQRSQHQVTWVSELYSEETSPRTDVTDVFTWNNEGERDEFGLNNDSKIAVASDNFGGQRCNDSLCTNEASRMIGLAQTFNSVARKKCRNAENKRAHSDSRCSKSDRSMEDRKTIESLSQKSSRQDKAMKKLAIMVEDLQTRLKEQSLKSEGKIKDLEEENDTLRASLASMECYGSWSTPKGSHFQPEIEAADVKQLEEKLKTAEDQNLIMIECNAELISANDKMKSQVEDLDTSRIMSPQILAGGEHSDQDWKRKYIQSEEHMLSLTACITDLADATEVAKTKLFLKNLQTAGQGGGFRFHSV